MPFPYPSSAASARSRRVKDKDKDTRSVTSTTSGRRQRDVARAHSRSSPPNPHAAQHSLYTQQNITLDQLPPLPSSGTASPSSAKSPVLRASQAPYSSGGVFQLPIQPHTPASLQPYLDDETSDQEISLTSEVPRTSNHPQSDRRDLFDPVAISTFDTLPADVHRTVPDSVSFRSSSPPLLSRSSTTIHAQSSPVLNTPRPAVPGPVYPTSPQAFAPSLPFRAGIPSEQFFASPYPGPPHFAMEQPIGHVADFSQPLAQSMPFFTTYGAPQPLPMTFNPTSSVIGQGHGFTNSRMGVPSEAFPGITQASTDPGERASVDSGNAIVQGREDDAGEVLHRIQNAIPDLHLLLNRYRETSGQLEVRENLIRQTEAQKAEALRQKEVYIERLARELDTVSHKHSAESSKLRLEIGNLEEKHKELQDSLAARKKSRDELEVANQDLQRQNALMERRSQEEREATARDFAQWKEDVLKEFETKQKAMDDELQRLKNAGTTQENSITDLKKRHDREMDAYRHGWAREKADLEALHTRTREDLESALLARQSELDETHKTERKGREAWARERNALVHGWEVERTRLCKDWEEQRLSLVEQHSREMDDIQRTLKASQEQRGRRADTENEKLKREVEKLKSGWDADKAKFNKATKDLKAVATKLDNENSSLQKLIEAFGEATDFKSRGDAYFIDAFNQWRKQISELAVEHCKEVSGHPPEHIMQKIPTQMPDFFSNSEASFELRAAYVEHVVSRILTQRVFQPFLFTLSRRNDSTDQLFQTMSQKLRQKSIRREAVWRQQTLHAAYTVSSAKQSINKIAAIIVEEIMDEIKYFTCPTQYEQVTVAIRRIVKIAAETWRYARLERELITASLSPEQHPGKFSQYEGLDIISGDISTRDASAGVVLPLVPLIEREPTHEDLRSSSDPDDHGCIFLRGVALYADSPTIVARLGELKQINAQEVPSGTAQGNHSNDQGIGQDPTREEKAARTELRPSPLLPSTDLPTHTGSQHVEEFSTPGLGQVSSSREAHSGGKECNATGSGHDGLSEKQGTGREGGRTPAPRTALDASSARRSSSTPLPPGETIPDWSGGSDAVGTKRHAW